MVQKLSATWGYIITLTLGRVMNNCVLCCDDNSVMVQALTKIHSRCKPMMYHEDGLLVECSLMRASRKSIFSLTSFRVVLFL